MTFKTDFPALSGRTVTQAHTDYCAANGHATHKVDGKDTGVCPRCGEVKPARGRYEIRWAVGKEVYSQFTDSEDSAYRMLASVKGLSGRAAAIDHETGQLLEGSRN